ncbi:MAG: glycosyltransferase family A protein [Cyanobacteria bacterium J06581_3]
MIVFIVPLKSKKISKNWGKVSQLLERTLKSVCNQTSDNFRVVIVCHERPDIAFEHPRASYVDVNFAPPNWSGNAKRQEDYQEIRLDKSRKLWFGLIHAQRFNPRYIMFVDADDCISNRIADFVSENSEEDGWLVCSGYEYQDGSQRIFCRNKHFNQRCGSSHIIRYEFLSHKKMKFEEVTWEYLRHQTIENMYKRFNKRFECLPFRGAVYITENAENIRSQTKYYLQRNSTLVQLALFHFRKAYKSFFSRKITLEIKDEFGI